MNILIILYFILFFGSIIGLLYPRKLAVRIAGINRFDEESIPFKYVMWVFVVGALILSLSTGLLIFELKDVIAPVPGFIEPLIEWLQG